MSIKAPKPPIRILMLVDERPGGACISYSKHPHAIFSLHTVLETLRLSPLGTGAIEVTRAHRQRDRFWCPEDPEPLCNFHFDQPGFNLDDYDQVWLFGLGVAPRPDELAAEEEAEKPTAWLTEAELKIRFAWMQDGGGVLAMGDHEDLGAALCGRIPRVRSMRKWSYVAGSTSPDNAPPINGPGRHDTLLKGNRFLDAEGRDHAAYYTQDDECDDQPMKLLVSLFATDSGPRPHALLTDLDGTPIDVLPDHPHEGEVVLPRDLTQAAGLGGDGPEYPLVHGERVAPVIVAYGVVQPDHTAQSDLNKGVARPRRFGVIGAYDGHRAGVGRVVVDATWHHWFDMNLVGFPEGLPLRSGDPRKRLGFRSTENQGPEHLRRIQRYFFNVATWLRPSEAEVQGARDRDAADGELVVL